MGQVAGPRVGSRHTRCSAWTARDKKQELLVRIENRK